MKTSLLLLLAALSLHAEEPALREAAECRARGGLPNVEAKARAGDAIRVGYLGGSITAAPGWRPKSLAWLKERHPSATFSEINAAIGGTGSDLGVFRFRQDVLEHKPDLLFVEFAVNDGGAAPDRIHRAMEGIVRQAWQADPATDICFVYTVSEPFLKDLQAGRCSRAATAMEEVADHYAIPSIHLGLEAARMAADGRLVFKGKKPAPGEAGPMVFSEDGVHPLVETGHELYLKAIERSWPALAEAGKAGPHVLPAPLRADNWERAKLVPVTRAMLSGAWQELDPASDPQAKGFRNRMPAMWKASEPGAKLAFSFTGETAAIYDLLGPDGGLLSVKLDDQTARQVARIDGYCTYHRLARLEIGAGLGEGPHRVEIELLPESPDKATILFEHNRPDRDKNPAKYAPNVWRLSSIMLIGDVVVEGAAR